MTDFTGMTTVDERMIADNREADWDKAKRNCDRVEMIRLLGLVGLKEQAEKLADVELNRAIYTLEVDDRFGKP